jgi:integrase
MRERLSDRFAAAVQPIPGTIVRYFDTVKDSPRGFLLRVTPAGAKAWCVQYRIRDTQRQREITIGDVRSWPIAEARKHGHALRREIDTGGDPLGEREDKRAAPNVTELAELFIAEALPSRAPRTQEEYRAMLRGWILPAIGRLKVAAVDRNDIQKLHDRISAAGKKRRANAIKSLVSCIFNQAIVWGLRAPHTNPAELVRSNPEHGRERYLTTEEIARLVEVLERWRPKRPDSVDAIKLALLTGARRGEIAGMTWGDVDLRTGIWTKLAGQTKQRRLHRVPLNEAAIAVLQTRKAELDAKSGARVVQLRADFVFRGGGSKTHCNLLERDWAVIRAAAGIEDVRFHDLRHSYASMLVGEGLSLPIIGKMLGHSKPATTARYAHLADKPLRDAAEIVGRIVRR